ncbi:hypothetical protein C8J56DRAFT_1064068 [Mycena floridula]|nr:hypothetical protein C8J56DRAFT_1064068 [Mycena floridula]
MDAATMAGKRDVIDKLIHRQLKIGAPEAHLLTFLTDDIKAKLSFFDFEHPMSRRMVLMNGPDNTAEVVVYVTSLIENKRTTPFINDHWPLIGDPGQVLQQRQMITLTRLGSQLFEHSVQCLNELLTLFERSYPQHAVETREKDTTTIQASNRYFMLASDAGSLKILTLDHEMDPHDILTTAAGGRYVFTEDNNVICFELQKGTIKGTTHYDPISIGQLRGGDIVELSISLVGFPVRYARNKVWVILHGITLLENCYSKVQNLCID